jgi:biotin-(acetyl-CoA carboxylase) ligase
VRRGSSSESFSNRLVTQGRRPGVLDLSVFLLARGRASPGDLGLLGTFAAACISEGIRRDTGIVSWLHWPDLITIDGRVVGKASLSFVTPRSSGMTQITIHISVNCFAGGMGALPSELSSTSVLEALGVEIDTKLLRDQILHALNWYHAEWEMGMHHKLVGRIQSTIAWLGHDVEVRTINGQLLKGKAMGLDDLGSLLLKQGRKTRTLPPDSVELVLEVK